MNCLNFKGQRDRKKSEMKSKAWKHVFFQNFERVVYFTWRCGLKKLKRTPYVFAKNDSKGMTLAEITLSQNVYIYI